MTEEKRVHKDFTNEEARALRGTEFTYIFGDGDTVRAFITEVDLSKGLTCKALERLTKRDKYAIWSLEAEGHKDHDNIICVTHNAAFDTLQDKLKEIVNTGAWKSPPGTNGSLGSCAF